MSEQTDQAILESLKTMAASLGGMAEVNRELLKANKDQANSLEEIDKVGGRSSKGIWRAADGIPVIGKVMRTVGSEITSAIKGSFELQKKALSRGMNLDKIMKKNATTTAYLGDSMTGFSNALETGYGMYEVGFRSNNKEMARLALQTKLTGQNQKKILTTMAQNTAGLGISQRGMSNLANTTLSVGQKYGMSTDELVTAVDALGNQLKVFGALGLGAEMMEAATKISGSLGPAMADVGPQLIAAFTDGNAMVQRSIMGISDEVAAAFSSSGKQSTDLMIDATLAFAQESNRLIDRYTAGAADQTFALKNATDIYGKQIIDGQRVYKKWDESAKKQGISIAQYVNNIKKSAKVSEEFQATWENFMAKVWSPIQEVFTKVANVFLKAITLFGPILVPLTQGILALIIAIGAVKIAILAATAAGKIKEAVTNPLGKWFDPRMAGGGKFKGGALDATKRKNKMTTAPGMKDWLSMPGVWARDMKDKFKGESARGKAAEKAKAAGGSASSKAASKAAAKKGASKAGAVPGMGGGGGGGGGIGGFLKRLGGGLKAIGSPAAMKGALTLILLGASIAVAAAGFAQFADVSWEQVGMGLTSLVALSVVAVVLGKISSQIMAGSAAIIVLGAALVPLAFAFSLLKGVGIDTMFGFAGALTVLALAAAAAFFIGPFIIGGAIAFGILGLALVPLAIALAIAGPELSKFSEVLAALAEVPIANLFLIGPALIGMALGFAALSAGGLISSVLDGLGSFFGGDSPVDKLVKMGNAAKHINKLEKSLKGIPGVLKMMTSAFKDVKLTPFYIFAEGIAIIKEALDSLGLFEMLKLGLFGKAMGGGGGKASGGGGKAAVVAKVEDKGVKTALDKLTAVYNKFADTQMMKTRNPVTGEDEMKEYRAGDTMTGGVDAWGKVHGPMTIGNVPGNDREVDRKVNRWKKFEGKEEGIQTSPERIQQNIARSKAGLERSTSPAMKELHRTQMEIWTKIAAHLEVMIEKTNEGNEQRSEGNVTRVKVGRESAPRPSDTGGGMASTN